MRKIGKLTIVLKIVITETLAYESMQSTAAVTFLIRPEVVKAQADHGAQSIEDLVDWHNLSLPRMIEGTGIGACDDARLDYFSKDVGIAGGKFNLVCS